MKAETEAEFQKALIQYAELRGWKVYHVRNVKGQLRNKSSVGFPDLVLSRAGRVIFAELKVGKNEPTQPQREWLLSLALVAVVAGPHVSVFLWYPQNWHQIEQTLR